MKNDLQNQQPADNAGIVEVITPNENLVCVVLLRDVSVTVLRPDGEQKLTYSEFETVSGLDGALFIDWRKEALL